MSDTPHVDIGHGLTAALRLSEGYNDLPDGIPVGVLLTHECAARGGDRVESYIPVNHDSYTHERNWTLNQRDPISMTPSVEYTCCSVHGWLTNGRWVPA